jgi:hypothetical protein
MLKMNDITEQETTVSSDAGEASTRDRISGQRRQGGKDMAEMTK